MNELTVLFFMLSIALYLARYFLRTNPEKVNWLTFFTSIVAMCSILTDTTLVSDEMIFMLVPVIFIVLMCGVTVITHEV